MEFTLLAAAALGAGGVYAMLWWEGRRGNAARCAGNLWDAALVAVVAGIFGGRIVAMILAGTNPLTHPGDILIVRAGVSTVGASLVAVATFLWSYRREPLAAADAIAAAALAGLAGWHAGCLFRPGGCLGTASDLPWAWAQPGSDVTRHPVEVYAAVALIVAAILLARWKAHGRPRAGVPASLAVAVAGGVRLLTEPLRPSLGGGPVWFYALATVVGAIGIVVFTLQARRARPASTTRSAPDGDEPVEGGP